MNENIIKNYAKEISDFLLELYSSPIKTIKKNHNLNWKQVFIYYSTVSIVVYCACAVFSGNFYSLIRSPIESTCTAIVYYVLFFWVSSLFLKKHEMQVEPLEHAQIWLKGALLSLIPGIILMFVPWMGILIACVFLKFIPALIIGGSVYIYLKETKCIQIEKAEKAGWITVISLSIFPLLTSIGILMGIHRFIPLMAF